MVRQGVTVRCAGRFRGGPCRRFLGVFLVAVGGLKCARCGHWNEIVIKRAVDAQPSAVA